MKRTHMVSLAAAALVVSAVAVPSVASASTVQPRDPDAPGCSVTNITADHGTGLVQWSIACDEERTVVVDATAFNGTPSDHTIVDEQQVRLRVASGESWTSSMTFATAGVDQLRAQAVTFVRDEDPFERPAIIGGATG